MPVFLLIYAVIAPTVTGTLVFAVLAMPVYSLHALMVAAAAGLSLAAFVAGVISKNIDQISAEFLREICE